MASKSSDLSNLFTVSWTVHRMPRNKTVLSSNFLFMDAEWHLEIYYSVNLKNISITLRQAMEGRKILKKYFSVSVFLTSKGLKCYTTVDTTCEVLGNFEHKELMELAPFDIVCVFHDATPSSVKNETTSLNPDMESLVLDFSKLLNDQTLSDVKLKCGDQNISVHKAVLSARSEVFSAMFRSGMTESESGVVELKDLDANILKLFLTYMYSGRTTDVTDEALPSLYAAADQYAVYALRNTCSFRMVKNLNEENCLSILALADAHSDVRFKSAVVGFICRHEKVLLSEVWLKFSKENPPLAVEVLQNFASSMIQVNVSREKNDLLS